MKSVQKIIIIGGGTAGIMTAAYFQRQQKGLDITIIEPSDKHFYQAAWTLVGAGTYRMKDTERREADLIPKGVKWIRDRVEKLLPENNEIILRSGQVLPYSILIVCPGLVMDLDALPGLKESLDAGIACSNYIDPEATWKQLKSFKGGNAIFTQADTPIKCGGAPQKILYLADEAFRKSGVREQTNLIYATPGSVIFGVKDFADTLNEVIRRKEIVTRYFYKPESIDPIAKKIYFSLKKEDIPAEQKAIPGEERVGDRIGIPFSFLHIAPPQKAPDFIRNSSLAVADGAGKGWLDVEIHSLQHRRFPNVFGLGDAAFLPTAKTGAAVRKQVPVVVNNVLALLRNQQATHVYSGYSSCPLVTGYGKMVLAEFKYNNVRDSDPLLSRFWDTRKELYPMWILKKYALPWLYWNRMMKGKMIG